MNFIITGNKNEGKTKTQEQLIAILRKNLEKAQQSRRKKIDIDGFICNKFFLPHPISLSVKYDKNNKEANEHHIGYDLIRVSNKTSIPFIRLMEYADPDFGEGLHYGPFIFFNNGITAGKKILQECYVNKTKNVIIDEIGKLELDGKVFADEIRKLMKYSDILNLFISVRTEFLESVLEKFGIKTHTIIKPNFSEKKIKVILENLM